MRALFRALGWLLLAIGLMAVGADAYWSWKVHGWTFEPIGAYVRRADPLFLAELRAASAHWSPRAARMAEHLLSWPVWGPAFVTGLLLVTVTTAHETMRPAPRARRGVWSRTRRER